MQSLVATVRHVGTLFDSINADANDHAEGLQMVTQSVDELGRVTQSNQRLARRTGVTAQVLQEQVQQLEHVLGAFRTAEPAPAADPLPELARRLAAAEAEAEVGVGQAPPAPPAGGRGVAAASEVEFF